MSPEERRGRRRRHLVAAGLELFGTRGFHATGVRDVCTEARLTERYFYESFPNREALFAVVYAEAVERLRERVLSALADASETSLPARAALRALLEQLRDEPRLARVVFVDVLTIGEDTGAASMKAAQSFSDIVFEAAEHAGLPRDPRIDHRLVASGLVGSTIYIVMQWAFNGFEEPLDHVLEHCALFYEALETVVVSRAEGS